MLPGLYLTSITGTALLPRVEGLAADDGCGHVSEDDAGARPGRDLTRITENPTNSGKNRLEDNHFSPFSRLTDHGRLKPTHLRTLLFYVD